MDILELTESRRPSALWMRRVLTPAIEALRLELDYSIELRSIGMDWGGFAIRPQMNPLGRVSINSSRVCFWTNEDLIAIYCHEVAHVLIERAEIDAWGKSDAVQHNHSAAFFGLLWFFYRRLDAAGIGGGQLVNRLGFYSIQDVDPRDDDREAARVAGIEWALRTIRSLPDDCSAEAAATTIIQQYWGWIAQFQSPARASALPAHTPDPQEQESVASSPPVFRWSLLISLSFFTVVYSISRWLF